MKKWNVKITDSTYYDDIEAETEQEAIDMALEWWGEKWPRWPDVFVEEVEEDEEDG